MGDALARDSELPDLAEAARPWMEILRLTDWQIRWKWVRYHELEEHKAGQIRWNQELRTAEVLILVPCDEAPDGVHRPYEEIIVHELLHIQFSLLDEDLNTTQSTLFERALNTTAAALVHLRGSEGDWTMPKDYWYHEVGEK